jgi:hypothetical protein
LTFKRRGKKFKQSVTKRRRIKRHKIFLKRSRKRQRNEIHTCGKIGHMSWDYPENKAKNQRNAHVAETKEDDVNAIAKEETPR